MSSNLITVEEAIAIGRKMLFWPRLLLILGVFLFGFLFAMLCLMLPNLDRESSKFVATYAVIVVLCFIPLVHLTFLFWSRRTTKWKLWAFENVDRVHDLDDAGRYAALFAKYGSFIDRIQVQSPEEREQWSALQSKLDNQDKYIDDGTVPQRVTIYLSTRYFIFRVVFCSLGILLGAVTIHFALLDNGPRPLVWLGGVIVIALLGLLFFLIRRFVQHKPELVLDRKGLETRSTGFHSWSEITNEDLVQHYMGKSGMRWFLQFYSRNGRVDVNITGLDTDWVELKRLIRVYRGRSGYVNPF